ncbi:hypothetical protein HDU96_003256 [Phlyctochytrium bullatum]|nr:hypothetical protein HDU96_003256 [Phlyctochytrium bullatum]
MTQSVEPEPTTVSPKGGELPPEVAGDQTFTLTIVLPQKAGSFTISAVPSVTVSDLRQLILESNECQFYTCFNLEFEGKRLEDSLDLGSIPGFTPNSSLQMAEAPYNDRDMRVHLTRFREVLTNFKSSTSVMLGADAGVSYLSAVSGDHVIYSSPKVEKESDKSSKKAVAKNDPSKPTVFADYNFDEKKEDISALIPEVTPLTTDQCLKSLTVSIWNPPPPQRRMAGDHMYLSVLTVEGVSLQITCAVTGFFVNRSTDKVFDPLPRAAKPCFSSTLPGCLSQASLGFQNRFPSLQAAILSRHPYEYFLGPMSYYPWVVRPETHEADLGRALDSVLLSAESLELMASRDWNEEIQSARELPRLQPPDRVLRDQMLQRHHTEFVDAACRAAVSIVSGAVPPMNPGDPEGLQMFIHAGIFFSHGNDAREAYERLGGAAAAHVAVSKDIDGISAVSALDVEGLYTVGTVVVDYKGHRLVGQSIIPGVLKRQQQQLELMQQQQASEVSKMEGVIEHGQEGETEVVEAEAADETKTAAAPAQSLPPVVAYGSIDSSKTISADEEFAVLAEKVAKGLHLAPHTVVDAEGKKFSLFTSVDSKGIVGDDGRRYLLDLARVMPLDIEFLEESDKETAGLATVEGKEATEKAAPLPPYPHRMTLLRTELVELFFETRLRAFLAEQIEKRREKAEKEKAEKIENGEEKAEGDQKAVEERKKSITLEDLPTDVTFDLRYNPDAFFLPPATPGVGGHDPESTSREGEEEVVRQMCKFLTGQIIASTALDFCMLPGNCPLDGQRLTKFFHSRGINMRYLGKVAKIIERLQVDGRSQFAVELCREEMVARAAKSILRGLLSETPIYLVANCIAHFLNCLYADVNAVVPPPSALRPPAFASGLGPVETLAYETLTPASLDAMIRNDVKARFRYDNLPADRSLTEGRRLPLLRSICLKVGIQLVARSYDWTAGFNCFNAADVVQIYPVIKFPEPKSTFAEELQEHGLYSLRQGQSQIGMDLMTEAASIYEQVYTAIHPETGRAFRNLSMLRHEQGDAEAGRAFMRKAVIVSERTAGFDDPETCAQYMNLGYFECLNGNHDAGFRYMRHALGIIQMHVSPYVHAELSSADTQVALMLAHCKRDISLNPKFLTRAVATNEAVFGKDHEMTARSYEHLCQGLMLNGDFRSALDAQRQVYRFVKARAGDKETEVVKDAAETLAALTQRAVMDAKREAEVNAMKNLANAGAKNASAVNGNGKKTNESSNGAKKSDGQGAYMKSKMAAQLANQSTVTAGAIRGNRGHLPVEELLKFIDDGGSGKKKKSKAAAAARAAAPAAAPV